MTEVERRPRPAPSRASVPPRPGRWVRRAFVVTALLVVGVHVAAVTALRTVQHDDAISYLAATGHEGAYAEALADPDGPTTRWVPAGEWKDFVQVDERLIFGRIRQDLIEHDIHPPMYFWLLHLVVAVVGVHVGTGPALNVALHLMTGFALWRLGRRVFTRRAPALAAVLLWSLSPAVVSTGLATRPYSLMTLAAVLLVLLAVDVAEPGARLTPARLGAIAAVTVVGFASQFQFGVVAAAAGSWVALRRVLARHPGTPPDGWSVRVRRAVRPVAAVASAMVAGALAAAVIAGDVAQMIARQREQAEPLTAAEFGLRLPWVPIALSELVWHDPPGPAGVTIGVLLVVAAVTAAVLVHRRVPSALARADGSGPGAALGIRRSAALGVVWCFLTVAGGILGAYLAGVSPRFAVEPRYLAPVWPFAAVTLVTLWLVTGPAPGARTVPLGRALATAAGAVVVLGMVASARPLFARPDTDPSATVAGVEAVVTDNIARGVLPRVVWHLPDDLPVRAASPAELATADDAFTPPGGGPALYVSVPGYEVVPSARVRMLANAERQGRVEPVDGSVWGIGDFFLVR